MLFSHFSQEEVKRSYWVLRIWEEGEKSSSRSTASNEQIQFVSQFFAFYLLPALSLYPELTVTSSSPSHKYPDCCKIEITHKSWYIADNRDNIKNREKNGLGRVSQKWTSNFILNFEDQHLLTQITLVIWVSASSVASRSTINKLIRPYKCLWLIFLV